MNGLKTCTPVEVSLHGRAGSFLFLIIVIGIGLLLMAETVLAGAASFFSKPDKVRSLLTLDSTDPRLEYAMGRTYEDSNPAESVKHLRRAAQTSPRNPLYWHYLAIACEAAGDPSCSDQSWEFLTQLAPAVPLYHWQSGQSFLRTSRVNDSVAQFRSLLDLDPSYGPRAWFALRDVMDPNTIFQKTIVHHSSADIKVAFINFLSGQGDEDAAYRIWKSVAPTLRPVPFASAQLYLERLIADDRIDEAEAVWTDLRRMGVVKSSTTNSNNNLIFNGDFEQTPLNAGFDWHQSDQTYLAIDFDAPDAQHGARCLRVDFTVNRNETYEPAYQIVPILPNHTYKLEAYVRSEDITSDSGPFLRVSDTQHSSFEDVLTETTVGTTPWHIVRLSFSTGQEAQSVRVSVWRPRGRTFPMEISGSFWMDSVSLHDEGHVAVPTSTDTIAAMPTASEGQR